MDVRNENRPTPRKPVLPTNEARQGITGHNVRYVLIGGTALVIIIFAFLYISYFTP